MEDLFARVLNNLVGRLTGPMQFRLYLQPLMACIFAYRAGMSDARQGKPPFLWALAFDSEHRRELLRSGWKDVGRVFIFAVVIDAIYQGIELRMFYPGEAIVVAIILAIVPYVLVRPMVTRAAGLILNSRVHKVEPPAQKSRSAVRKIS